MQYIVEMWEDVGKCKPSGFEVVPVSWTEIKSYADINHIAEWEMKLLHMMSKAFVDARATFNDERCEPPYLFNGISFRHLSAQAADAKMIAIKQSPS